MPYNIIEIPEWDGKPETFKKLYLKGYFLKIDDNPTHYDAFFSPNFFAFDCGKGHSYVYKNLSNLLWQYYIYSKMANEYDSKMVHASLESSKLHPIHILISNYLNCKEDMNQEMSAHELYRIFTNKENVTKPKSDYNLVLKNSFCFSEIMWTYQKIVDLFNANNDMLESYYHLSVNADTRYCRTPELDEDYTITKDGDLIENPKAKRMRKNPEIDYRGLIICRFPIWFNKTLGSVLAPVFAPSYYAPRIYMHDMEKWRKIEKYGELNVLNIMKIIWDDFFPERKNKDEDYPRQERKKLAGKRIYLNSDGQYALLKESLDLWGGHIMISYLAEYFDGKIDKGKQCFIKISNVAMNNETGWVEKLIMPCKDIYITRLHFYSELSAISDWYSIQIMEYAPKGSLAQKKVDLGIKNNSRFLFTLLHSMYSLHRLGLSCDCKRRNWLIFDNDTVRLCDLDGFKKGDAIVFDQEMESAMSTGEDITGIHVTKKMVNSIFPVDGKNEVINYPGDDWWMEPK